jgi:hypothetical protein
MLGAPSQYSSKAAMSTERSPLFWLVNLKGPVPTGFCSSVSKLPSGMMAMGSRFA